VVNAILGLVGAWLDMLLYVGMVFVSSQVYGPPISMLTHVLVLLVAFVVNLPVIFGEFGSAVIGGKYVQLVVKAKQFSTSVVSGAKLVFFILSVFAGVYMFFTNPLDNPTLFCVGMYLACCVRLISQYGVVNSAGRLVAALPICLSIDGFLVVIATLEPTLLFGIVLVGFLIRPKSGSWQY